MDPYTTQKLEISVEVDDMFCPTCGRMGYWIEGTDRGRFVCPEHQGGNNVS